ncbi:MAG TPA: PilZ domain-containing protein [Candidatus Hydrogenedentes bacterium]|nr:PilZ domain-containing protein [Candidatus Hydrogenedentota bacterium]
MIDFPQATLAQLLWGLGLFAGLIIVAFSVERLRQRKRTRLQRANEWETVESIIRDKELTPEEQKALRALIRKQSPKEPLRAVTVRQHFEQCVEQVMGELLASRDRGQYSQMGALLHDVRVALALDYVPLGQRIQSTRELSPSQIVSLALTSDTMPRWHMGRVESVDEAYLYISLDDLEVPSLKELRAGAGVRARLWREDDARYVFTLECAGLREEPPAFVFLHSTSLDRLQTRRDYRMRHEQTTSIGVISKPLDDQELERLAERPLVTKLRGRITNLSAGGCALVVQQPIPGQVLLRIALELDDQEPFDIFARIVSTLPISGGRSFVRASFVATDDETRDKIARYIIRRQQNLSEAHEPEH